MPMRRFLDALESTPAFDAPSEPPSLNQRLLAALAIGLTCGIVSWMSTRNPVYNGQDFNVWWEAARDIVRGHDPYQTNREGAWAGLPRFNYPLPTALLAAPFVSVPVTIAGAVFFGASCFLLAFIASSSAWWPLWIFASGAMIMAAISAQITPLVTVGVLCPGLAWLGVFKPNLGLAMLLARPSWKTTSIMLGIGAVSLFPLPTWPFEWIENVRGSRFHFSPITTPGGFLLLAALLKWRRPEARMLVGLALVPSSPIVYEAVFVSTIARTRMEMIWFSILSCGMQLLMADRSLVHDTAAYFARARPAMLLMIYMPALVMVLRRRNEGRIPPTVERWASRLPSWLRGRSSQEQLATRS